MIMDSKNYKPQDLGQTEMREWEERLDKRWNLWHKSDDKNYNFTTCQEDIKSFIQNLLLFQEQRHREDLDKLLEQGHGGGNWRRLITMLRDKYK
jgi:hypothetical protein